MKLPIHSREKKALAARARRLMSLFATLPTGSAPEILNRLTNPTDLLNRLFECELSEEFRTKLIGLLLGVVGSEELAAREKPLIRERDPEPLILKHPTLNQERYIDRLATTLGCVLALAQWDLIWIEDGVERVVNISRGEVSFHTGTLIPLVDKVFPSEAAAREEVDKREEFIAKKEPKRHSELLHVAFYKGPHETILPTLYTVGTAPRFFDGMKRYFAEGYIEEDSRMFTAYYRVLRDFVNPLPVGPDENENLSLKAPKLSKGMKTIIGRGGKNIVLDFFRNLKRKIIWTSSDGKHIVYMTEGDQVVGSFEALGEFRKTPQGVGYAGWHRHHIVEQRHLKALGIRDLFPTGEKLPCVFLPSVAHSNRIYGDLAELLPRGGTHSDVDVFVAYAQVYRNLEDYTGKGIHKISGELLTVVRDMLGFSRANVDSP